MDYLDNFHYFVLSHKKKWLSVFGCNREFSVRLLIFSVRLLKIEIFTENHVISEVAITALLQKICYLNPRIPESLELFPGLTMINEAQHVDPYELLISHIILALM